MTLLLVGKAITKRNSNKVAQKNYNVPVPSHTVDVAVSTLCPGGGTGRRAISQHDSLVTSRLVSPNSSQMRGTLSPANSGPSPTNADDIARWDQDKGDLCSAYSTLLLVRREQQQVLRLNTNPNKRTEPTVRKPGVLASSNRTTLRNIGARRREILVTPGWRMDKTRSLLCSSGLTSGQATSCRRTITGHRKKNNILKEVTADYNLVKCQATKDSPL